MNDKTEMNMAAAKMLGLKPVCLYSGGGVTACDDTGSTPQYINIFTFNVDFLAALIRLLDEGWFFYAVGDSEDEGYKHYAIGKPSANTPGAFLSIGQGNTPEEAVGAACVAVVEGE